jgi:hypothetical protein
MGREKRRVAFDPTVGLGAVGVVVGMLVSPAFPSTDPGLVALAGFVIGIQIGGLVVRLQDLRLSEAKPAVSRRHYQLRKDLRDSYYTDLVMKRIMHAYHVQEDRDDECAEGDELEEAKSRTCDDPFTWPNDLRAAHGDEEGQEAEPAHRRN